MAQGRTPFEQIARLLQDGGALGAYQAGVYEALAEAELHPDWVAGISIGAINSAIIAGNAPKRRVDAFAARRSLFQTDRVRRRPASAGQSGACHKHPFVRRAEFLCAAPAATGRLAARQS